MRPVSIKNIPIEHQLSILLLSALFLTNHYLSLPADSRWVDFAAGDSYSYIAIANAFPSLPAADAILSFHHSQRFFSPYLVGGVAWLLHVPAQSAFLAFAVLAVLGIVLVFHGIVNCPTPEPSKKMILLSLLLSNTYMFRYYGAIPRMISDIAFQLSLAVLLLGLLRESPGLTFAGLLASALSKQTALLLIPGAMGWIWFEWKSPPRSAECSTERPPPPTTGELLREHRRQAPGRQCGHAGERDHSPSRRVNVLSAYPLWPVLRCRPMAGFGCRPRSFCSIPRILAAHD
jgi:hypothetical protein